MTMVVNFTFLLISAVGLVVGIGLRGKGNPSGEMVIWINAVAMFINALALAMNAIVREIAPTEPPKKEKANDNT